MRFPRKDYIFSLEKDKILSGKKDKYLFWENIDFLIYETDANLICMDLLKFDEF